MLPKWKRALARLELFSTAIGLTLLDVSIFTIASAVNNLGSKIHKFSNSVNTTNNVKDE
ncbi:hypothetical protein BDW66DRAFT_139349 [Aspergillus desertorum]